MSLQSGLWTSKWLHYLLVSHSPSDAGLRHRAAPALARKTCPLLAVTCWHAQPLHTLCTRGLHRQLCISSRKQSQLLNLQPSLHQEMAYNCNTAVRRSAVCPAAAVGIARGITASPTILPASIAGMCVTWVVAQILFISLCQSMSFYAHLFSKRDMIHPANTNGC